MHRYAEVLGIEPSSVVQPVTQNEIETAIAAADAAGQAVIPWGGGTGQNYGYPPSRADIVLDLSRFNRILAHEPGDLTITVEAGATLADVQTVLARENQFLPLDPPYAAQATMGGIIATNAYGPSRVGWGSVRDWLIGLTVIDPQGRPIKGGGKVVKNVTGYDLPKLHVGALGTLGVITEATFKVAPKPETIRALLFRLTGANDIAIDNLLSTMGSRRVAPSLSLLDESRGERHLFVSWSGPREAVDGECDAAAALCRELSLRAPLPLGSDFAVAESDPDQTHLRLRVPPQDAWMTHCAVSSLHPGVSIQTMAPFGCLEIFCANEEESRMLLTWAVKTSATLEAVYAPLALRREENSVLWHPLPPAFPLMRSLKAALDPKGTLNPRRFVGKL